MSQPALKITMIGTGYVGLVSGTCFADVGFDVTCVDIDAEKIAKLRDSGEIPIYEPGLKELVQKNTAAGRLHFTTDLADCVPTSDAVFIAVGTPQDEDGSADMKYVLAASEQIAQHLQGYTVIVNKSTVPVGTGARVDELMRQTNPQAAFDVVSNPEFLREGAAIDDFANPDRVVVGAETEEAMDVMRALYKPLTDEGAKFVATNRTSSEMIKYAANAFLAMKITFMNEMSALCDKVDADVLAIAAGIGSDSRIGEKFLRPGPGYGGSCVAKDTNAMAKTARDFGSPLKLIETTIATNQEIKESMVARIEAACGGSVNGKALAILGVAFKANTDDMRDAPALTILPELQKRGAIVKAYDPEATVQASRLLPEIQFESSLNAVIDGADAAILLTEWAEFREMSLENLQQNLLDKNLIDLRNVFDAPEVEAAGLTFHGLGRGKSA